MQKEGYEMFLERYMASTMFSDQERQDLKKYCTKNDGFCRFFFDPDYECCRMKFQTGNTSTILVHVTEDGYSIKIDGNRTQDFHRWVDIMNIIENS